MAHKLPFARAACGTAPPARNLLLTAVIDTAGRGVWSSRRNIKWTMVDRASAVRSGSVAKSLGGSGRPLVSRLPSHQLFGGFQIENNIADWPAAHKNRREARFQRRFNSPEKKT